MQDALVEDYFMYEELAEMEAETIRHNMTGVKNDNIYYEEVNAVPNELDPEGDENNSHEVLDNFETENNSRGEARFQFFSDEDTDAFITEQRNGYTKRKTKSDIKIVKDFFATIDELRNPADIPLKELDSLLARFYLGARKKDCTEYEPSSLQSINNSLDRYFKDNKLPFR